MNQRTVTTVLLAAGLLLSESAQAHPGHGGFLTGVVHPFGGLDHLLAMITAGMWASRLTGSARLAVPAVFMIATGAGALGVVQGAFVESALLCALLAAGLGLLSRQLASLPVAVGLMLVSGVLQGAAHAADMGEAVSRVSFIPGMLLGTVALQAVGLAAGLWLRRRSASLTGAWGAGVAAFATVAVLT